MSEQRPPFDIPVRDRHHRNVEQIGEPSQPTPIREPNNDWLEQDARQTMRELMQAMRNSADDTLNGAEQLHALSNALSAVNIVRCTFSNDHHVEFESDFDTD